MNANKTYSFVRHKQIHIVALQCSLVLQWGLISLFCFCSIRFGRFVLSTLTHYVIVGNSGDFRSPQKTFWCLLRFYCVSSNLSSSCYYYFFLLGCQQMFCYDPSKTWGMKTFASPRKKRTAWLTQYELAFNLSHRTKMFSQINGKLVFTLIN